MKEEQREKKETEKLLRLHNTNFFDAIYLALVVVSKEVFFFFLFSFSSLFYLICDWYNSTR